MLSLWPQLAGRLVVSNKEKKLLHSTYFSLGLQMLISSLLLITITETSGMAVPLNSIPLPWWSIAYLVIIGL
jgi:hypothetical protein